MSTAHWQARRLPIPAAWPVRSSPAVHPWAIISAGLAPILLTGAYLIAGILPPASYSPVRTTISAMAGQAGTDRWVMTGGIFLVGGCYLVTAAGLTGVRASARALLAGAGLAGIGIAASPDPASGATPRHLAWTVLGAVTIAVWPAFAARRASPRPLILSVYGSAAVTAVFAALLGWLLAETARRTGLRPPRPARESICPRTPTPWPRGTSSSRGSACRRGSATRDRPSRTRTGTAHGCSSSRSRRTRPPRTASTSTSVRLPDCGERTEWPRWHDVPNDIATSGSGSTEITGVTPGHPESFNVQAAGQWTIKAVAAQ